MRTDAELKGTSAFHMGTVAHQSSRQWNAVVSRTTLPARLSVSWVVRKLLAAVFLASFLQYWTGSLYAQYVHIALLIFAGMVVLAGRERRKRLHDLLRGGALLFGAVLFTEVVSYTSGDRYSFLYGATLIGVILSARLILQQIGLPEVLRSYFQAGVFVTGFLVIAGRSGITGYTAGARFSGNGSAHPNLVAFLLAGYLPIMIWRTLEYPGGRKRMFLGAMCLLNFLLIFLSGSRASLLAVAVGGLSLALRLWLAGRFKGKIKLRHFHLILVLLLLPFVAYYLAQHGRIGRLEDFFNTALSLNSSQRGLKSGLSGRTGIWAFTLRRLNEQDRWLFGFGFRMGDLMVGTIDNGYIQLLFEAGLLSGLLILGLIINVFVRLWRLTQSRVNNAWLRYHYALWAMIIIYLTNNIATRYLFSFGNSFSIFVIFLMVASESELRGRALPAQLPRKTPRWMQSMHAAFPPRSFGR